MKDVSKSQMQWTLKLNYNVERTHLLFWNEVMPALFQKTVAPSPHFFPSCQY